MAKKKKELSLEERVEKLEKDLLKKERSLKYYIEKNIKNVEFSIRAIENNTEESKKGILRKIDGIFNIMDGLERRKMNRLFRFKKKK